MSLTNDSLIPRGTGLLIIEVRNSNPNGDPDRESDPRTRAHDKRGIISDVSFKRKPKDLVWNGRELPEWGLDKPEPPTGFLAAYDKGRSPVWEEMAKVMGGLESVRHQIYVSRGRTYHEPKNAAEFQEFRRRFWDARVFGNTVIENEGSESQVTDTAAAGAKSSKKKNTKKESGRFIRTGVAQFGLGVSVAKVRIQRDTNTVVAAVQTGRSRGMAPLGFRVIEHGVYAMPFLINPSAAQYSECSKSDIELLLRLIPFAYPHTPSRIRPFVEVRHAWYFQHKRPLGSVSDFAIIDELTPMKSNPEEPSTSWNDYEYDGEAKLQKAKSSSTFKDKFSQFGDLCDPEFVKNLFGR